MNVTIEVTQEDIAHGLTGDCLTCPVARAITRALGIRAHVGPDSVGLGGSPRGGQVVALLPWLATDFIRRFDGGGLAEPFTFVLDVPGELIPAGAR